MAYLAGVRAAPGLGLGVAVQLKQTEIAIEEAGQGAAHESQCLRAAIAMVNVKPGAAAGKGGAQAAILGAHLAFLDDPELMRARARRKSEGKSAGAAWRDAIEAQIAILQGLERSAFASNASSDLVDLERQVLMRIGRDASGAGAGCCPPAPFCWRTTSCRRSLPAWTPRGSRALPWRAAGRPRMPQSWRRR